ncbi:hypothetical protein A6769_05990 [Nostoc punctiforme NIES-2108]|uniref:Uncharacterized protein n=1 Tax=Nostoc punctiforme NIES-2108 TaxID=1356359 RepID=A0A367RTW8_NOSPU|nr:hypothetical protein A6769_05990 [Nostoc punctiforme NIES-2108]
MTSTARRKSKVKSQKSKVKSQKNCIPSFLRHLKWYVYLSRAVLVVCLITFQGQENEPHTPTEKLRVASRREGAKYTKEEGKKRI